MAEIDGRKLTIWTDHKSILGAMQAPAILISTIIRIGTLQSTYVFSILLKQMETKVLDVIILNTNANLS